MEPTRKTEARAAFGLKMPGGSKEMIGEPMVKQVCLFHPHGVFHCARGFDMVILAKLTLVKARAAGLAVPGV